MSRFVSNARRNAVPFDPFLFQRLRQQGRSYALEEAFRLIYETNHWGAEQRSGRGASLDQVALLLHELSVLIADLKARVLLDVPCGDFSWIQHLSMEGCSYTGGDLLRELVDVNNAQFGNESRTFQVLDLTRDSLPPADLLLCRDCLVHLSNADIDSVLTNISRASIEFFLSTTFPACAENEDIVSGDWRVINLELPPFNLPRPLRLISERCSEGDGRFIDKSLGLWRVADLPKR